jgi:hypothetical protein
MDGIWLGYLEDRTGETMHFGSGDKKTTVEWLEKQIDCGYAYLPFRELSQPDPRTCH